MANWKHYMNSGYRGCTLIAHARDHCRARDVRIYMIPGVQDAVGIADGTDSFIAPVSADCFSVNVKRIFDDLQAGKGLPKVEPLAYNGRRRLLDDAAAPPEAPAAPRRRILEAPAATPQGGRRALLQP